ncbi:MAG: diguanylate cyclase domain-containing protein [Acidimicrobiales bacterium]
MVQIEQPPIPTYEDTDVLPTSEDTDVLPTSVRRQWITRMLSVVRRLGTASDLHETLQMITEGVVELLEFGAASLNVVQPDGTFCVEAVAGPPALAEALLGRVGPAEIWHRMLAACDEWGELLYLPAERQPVYEELASWTPPPGGGVGPGAWDVDDSLFAPLRDQTGAMIGVLCVDAPASGLKPDMEQRTLLELFAAEAANAIADAARRARLVDSEGVLRKVFTDTPMPMLICDQNLELFHANTALRQLAAMAEDRPARNLGELVPVGDVDGLSSACRAVADGDSGALTVEHRLVRFDRSVRWVRSSVSRIDTETGRPRLIVRLEDVTEDRQTLEELRHLADHDALTGLPNRRIARRRLEQLLTERTGHEMVVVLYCDVDGFKAVNDRLGHTAGDELLTLVASRLSRVIRPPDLLCREGGDEFVVVATTALDANPEAVAQRCIDGLAPPFALRGGQAQVSLSVGIAVGREVGVTAAELLREADSALYRAKYAGRNRWAFAA